MKRFLTTVAALALSSSPALAQFANDYTISTFHGEVIMRDGVPVNREAGIPTPGSIYSNIAVENYFGAVYGGTAAPENQAGNTITGMVMDDLSLVGVTPNQDITQVTFTVANLNTVAVTVRPRIRFWFDNGQTPGAPGTYYNNPGNVGFSASSGFAFDPNSVTRFTFTLGPNLFKVASNLTMWAGVTFDNINGTTGATAAQLANFGQAIWGATADIGSSDPNNAFETFNAGSFFTISDPAGQNVDFLYPQPGSPPANFGWELVQAPEPATMALVGFGVLGLLRRRR